MQFDEKLLIRATCIGFFMGALLGMFMGTWAHFTLFWGRDSVNDVSMVFCFIITALCAVVVLQLVEKGAKKSEQV